MWCAYLPTCCEGHGTVKLFRRTRSHDDTHIRSHPTTLYFLNVVIPNQLLAAPRFAEPPRLGHFKCAPRPPSPVVVVLVVWVLTILQYFSSFVHRISYRVTTTRDWNSQSYLSRAIRLNAVFV